MAPVKTPTEGASGDVLSVESGSTGEDVPVADLMADADDWHVLGSPDAPVTIVEYADFQ
jgi:protein-disulfide isomerase